jgi:DNA-binding NtrC family response regulator
MPDLDGIEVLARFRDATVSAPVIVLTAHGEVRSAVRAIQLGAFDYLSKPIDTEEIVIVVRRALEARALRAEVADLRRRVDEGDDLPTLMGPSREVAHVAEQVRTVAGSSFSVLVLGETGSGKELVAQAIHRQSERRAEAFVALDCGAIPETLLESELFGHEKGAFTGAAKRKRGQFSVAERGTLFLDEVGNLPVALQSKLLRVLESRQLQVVGASKPTPVDVRFVAATNDDLQTRAREGRFRADLFFRLAQYTISVPPLRDRPDDIGYLANRFMAEASVELRRPMHEIARDAHAALLRYAWPGNVRQLRNVVRQAVLESRDLVLRRVHVQPLLGRQPSSGSPVPALETTRSLREVAAEAAREAERQLITDTLLATGGNKSEAARRLRTDYKTLHLKMKSLGVRARDFSP